MKLKYFHKIDIFTFALVLYMTMNVLLALIPSNHLIEYAELEVSPTMICSGAEQRITGTRNSLWNFPAHGVDKIINTKNRTIEYRWDWKSSYAKGETKGSWNLDIELEPGTYRWEADVWLDIPFMQSKKIDPVISSEFEVIECK